MMTFALMGKWEGDKIIIEFDTRERDHHKIFKLKRVVKIRWINERAVEAQELSGFAWPIIYRITTDNGYNLNEQSQRVYFTPEVAGLPMHRRALDAVLRLGIFLCIIAGLGARQATWLMEAFFQAPVSKSAIDRWVDEVGDSLPSEEMLIQLLHKENLPTQGRFNEVFPFGADKRLVALNDFKDQLWGI